MTDATPTTSRARRWLAIRLTVLLALVLAAALSASPPAAQAARPVEVARALQDGPLYVDATYADTVPSATRRSLTRRLRALERPTRLILAPVVPGDAAGGDASTLVETVSRRLRDAGVDADGDYLVVDDGFVTGVTVRGGGSAGGGPAQTVAYLFNGRDTTAANFERPIGETASLLVDELGRPTADVTKDLDRVREQSEEAADRADGSGAPWVLVGLLVLLVAAATALIVRRRRGALVADGPLPVIPDRVFEHARAARRADLREDADEQVLALAEVLDRQPVPDEPAAQEAYQEALDAMTGARRRTTPEASTVDLVGVLVLVDHARRALARAGALDAGRRVPNPAPLCTLNPLHGRAATGVGWGVDLRVPACEACATALRDGRAPDALRDGDRPYFEGDSVWARTGFGALADDLVARVSRGER